MGKVSDINSPKYLNRTKDRPRKFRLRKQDAGHGNPFGMQQWRIVQRYPYCDVEAELLNVTMSCLAWVRNHPFVLGRDANP